MTIGLKLSESEAARFIAVMRKSRIIPELKMAIQNNELSVSKAARVISVIKTETATTWIETAKTGTFREIEKQVATLSPKAIPREKTTCFAPDAFELKAVLSTEAEQMLRRAQDLLSKMKRRSLALGEVVVEELARLYIENSDPLKKKGGPRPVTKTKRPSTWVVQSVTQRDKAQCTQLNPDGSRCPRKNDLFICTISSQSVMEARMNLSILPLCAISITHNSIPGQNQDIPELHTS